MKILLPILIFLLLSKTSIAQMGISAAAGFTPNSSAMLDISSNSKGFLLPRMTSAQRIAITSPAEGLTVYDTDTKTKWYFNGSSWVNQVAGASLNIPYAISQNYNGEMLSVTNSSITPFTSAILGKTTGAGFGIHGVSVGNGYAGFFTGNNPSAVYSTLFTKSYGESRAFMASAGTGSAGFFEIASASNSNTALQATTNGDGAAITAYNAGNGTAFSAVNNNNTPTARLTNNSASNLALELQGGIKVSGTEAQKTAFKIVSNASNISFNQIIIPNTTQANNINDILIITHNYGSGATQNFTKPCGVYWDPIGNWRIYVEDSTAMPVGVTFNVLVIKQ